MLFLPSVLMAEEPPNDEPLKKVGEMNMTAEDCNRIANQDRKYLEEQKKKKEAPTKAETAR